MVQSNPTPVAVVRPQVAKVRGLKSEQTWRSVRVIFAPVRVFVSYKRHVEPDEPFALRLVAWLSEFGHQVFIDQGMLIGTNWSETIDKEIAASDYLIVLLTEAASHSEALLAEIETATRCCTESGKPVILPIRLEFTGDLPYVLGLHLDPLQFALWDGGDDTTRVFTELARALEGHLLRSPSVGMTQSLRPRVPAYAVRIPPPGGTLDADDPFYIEPREAAAALAQVCDRERSSTLVVKAPRQMGKSSLLVRLVAAALETGKRAVLIDLQIFGHHLREEGRLYSRFAAAICEQLELPCRVDDFWDSKSPEPMNCTRFVERQVLPHVGPTVLAIDEAERLIDSPFRDDFYGMLRSWHNLRGHPLKKAWKALSMVLVISTEPSFLIQGAQSPFNVVDPLTLPPLTMQQVASLNQLHGAPLDDEQARALHDLVGGQPYLTRKALYELTVPDHKITPAQFFASAASDGGPFRDHLRRFLLVLEGLPELKTALGGILHGVTPSDIRLAYRLQSAGLVTVVDRSVKPACELYAQYFRRLNL